MYQWRPEVKYQMSRLRDFFAPYWMSIQATLFPWLEEELGPLTEKQRKLVETLEITRVEEILPPTYRVPGRPLKDRAAVARAFLAKSVYGLTTTRSLLDRLENEEKLRRICGWEKRRDVPSESVFSRAFAEFAKMELPTRAHEVLVRKTCSDRIVGHISRDSTAVEVREKPVAVTRQSASENLPASTESRPSASDSSAPEVKPTVAQPDAIGGETATPHSAPVKRRRGRPRKGEEPAPKEPTRLQRQGTGQMSLEEMINDLPSKCDVGTKKNSHGYKVSWIGYKLHIDAADGQIPISCILTSASVHDSQVAIPLATMTAGRVTNLYDLMDAAYDAKEIKDYSRSLKHVPIIDANPRSAAAKEELEAEGLRRRVLGIQFPEEVRFNERTTVERVNSRFKDELGGRHIRVRGALKVMCHAMFGILALTADQLLRLAIG